MSIGASTGRTNQRDNSVALGPESGFSDQGARSEVEAYRRPEGELNSAVAVGNRAGYQGQCELAVASGYRAGESGQLPCAVAVGPWSGSETQGFQAVSLGANTGRTRQRTYSVAVGSESGRTNQGLRSTNPTYQQPEGELNAAVAIGARSGYAGQCELAVAIGYRAGESNQLPCAVAVGPRAGLAGQGFQAIAIGANAGSSGQADYAIAIGPNSGIVTVPATPGGPGTPQARSICLNASSNALSDGGVQGFFVDPVRTTDVNQPATSETKALYYDTDTKEIYAGPVPEPPSPPDITLRWQTFGRNVTIKGAPFNTVNIANTPQDFILIGSGDDNTESRETRDGTNAQGQTGHPYWHWIASGEGWAFNLPILDENGDSVLDSDGNPIIIQGFGGLSTFKSIQYSVDPEGSQLAPYTLWYRLELDVSYNEIEIPDDQVLVFVATRAGGEVEIARRFGTKTGVYLTSVFQPDTDIGNGAPDRIEFKAFVAGRSGAPGTASVSFILRSYAVTITAMSF